MSGDASEKGGGKKKKETWGQISSRAATTLPVSLPHASLAVLTLRGLEASAEHKTEAPAVGSSFRGRQRVWDAGHGRGRVRLVKKVLGGALDARVLQNSRAAPQHMDLERDGKRG